MARILISAGEPSGDRYAAAVVRELLAARPATGFAGLGGTQLEEAGVRLYRHAGELTAMGIAEVITSVPRHYRLLQRFKRELRAGMFDMALLVDYPDFNLRLARIARAAGVPVLYYVAPQLWAWRPGRARRLRHDVTELAVILPFETEYLGELGVAATWVGHPLLDVGAPPPRDAARRALGIDPGTPVIALLPGSRPGDIARHWPLFGKTAERLSAAVPGVTFLAGAVVPAGTRGNVRVVPNSLATVLAAADVALCKSGTVSLEAALAGLPNVIAYRMNAASHFVARRLVRVPHIGLANLILGERVAPEFVQDEATPGNLARQLGRLLDPADAAGRSQRDAFGRLRGLLGEPGAAHRVARLALGMLA